MESRNPMGTPTIPKMGWKIELLGGENFASAPTAVSRKPGGVDVFVRDSSNNLWYISRNGTEWLEWQNLGGPIYGTPSAVYHGTDNTYLDCFARDAEFNILRKRRSGGTWSGWEKYPLNATAREVVVSHRSETEFDMFLRGTKDTLEEVWYGESYNDRIYFDYFRDIGLVFSPTCSVSSIEGNIFCYALDNNKHVICKSFESDGESEWELRWYETTASGAPAATFCGKNQHLFVCDEDSNLCHINGDERFFHGIENLGFKVNHWPSAVSWGLYDLNCFVVGTDRRLYYIHN